MKNALVLAAGLAAMVVGSGPVRAADFAVPPATVVARDWAGFYAGVNGGYGWGRSQWSDPAFGTGSRFDTSGGLFGGQFGYNWRTGALVLGLETDLDWTNIGGSLAGIGGVCGAAGGGQCRTEQDWFGTTRGRVGYAFGKWLPYITGGVAYGNIKTVQPSGSSSKVNAGWAAGAGVEYALNPNWSAKVEYLHLDLGTATFFDAASKADALKAPVTDDLVRAGINYHW